MKTNIHFWSYLAQFFLEWENFQTKGVEQIKTRMLSSITFFFLSKIVSCKNTVEPDGPQKTIWRMHISWSIPKATNTNSEFVILIALPLQQWLHERAWMLRYMYIACVVYYWSKPIPLLLRTKSVPRQLSVIIKYVQRNPRQRGAFVLPRCSCLTLFTDRLSVKAKNSYKLSLCVKANTRQASDGLIT